MSLTPRILVVALLMLPGLAMASGTAAGQSLGDVPAESISALDDVAWNVGQQAAGLPRPDTFDPLKADRPDFTESPSTVGLGRLMIEGGWTYLRDRSAGVDLDMHVLPELLLRYGLTERVELRLAWLGYATYRERDATAGEVYAFDGTTDLWVGCKLQVTEEHGWRPESCLIVSVSSPVGATGWTSGQTESIVNYCYGWDLTERVSLGGSTGSWWSGFDGDHFTVTHQSLVLGAGITERWGCYLEWFGLFFDGANDNRPDHYLDGGFTYLVTEDFQLDWRIGVGLSESADDLFTGVGFAVRR